MTGPATLKNVPTKNPPAQPSGFENFFSALAVFILRPQAEIKSALFVYYTTATPSSRNTYLVDIIQL
jgi:hypothetical protein